MFTIVTTHSEHATVYTVVDSSQPDDEQPAVVMAWSTADEPNARYLAHDFVARHNARRAGFVA